MRRFLAIAAVVAVASLLSVAAPYAESGEYYYNAGRRVAIVRSPTRVAVRVGAAASKEPVVARLAAVEGVVAVRDVKAGGIVEVTLADGAAKAPGAGLTELAREVGGDLLPVYYEPGAERDASTLFIADDMLVRFNPGVTRAEIDAVVATAGVEIVEPLRYAPNGFKLRVVASDLGQNAVTAANAIFETGLCEWAHPNFLAHRSPRFAPNDPQYPNQWHLNNTGAGGGTSRADVRAEQAWEITQGSPDISIAVADTGIDFQHEDFNDPTDDGRPKVHDPRDVVHGDDDPSPKPSDANGAHGTSAAGVAVAEFENNYATAGIAPKCRFVPIQLYAESTFTPNATEADAFTWAADHADIMSNSWGPDNDDTPLPDATRAAIDYATTTGRGGKGTVIFFAAGNSADDTVHDNYVSYPSVVCVAASTNLDVRAGYSRFGDALSVSAPSSGGTLSITTTDVTGGGGYSAEDFTSTFGGTSSACPLAAGIGALVLSVSPDLTWQQVKAVIEATADKIDTANGQYDAFGHSRMYGYGRVNAFKALVLARAEPAITKVKLKKQGTKRSLVVDGSGFSTGAAELYVGETRLGQIKFPGGRVASDGTATRVVSKDPNLAALIPDGSTVTITIRHAATGREDSISYTR